MMRLSRPRSFPVLACVVLWLVSGPMTYGEFSEMKAGVAKAAITNEESLVMVNGNPVGYPPLDLPKEPGLYRISASLPGRPDTQQSQQVNLQAGATAAVEFSF